MRTNASKAGSPGGTPVGTQPGASSGSDQALLYSIIQGSPIPQFVISSDHRVLYWNQALEQYSGVTAAQVVGTSRHWSAFYDHERPLLADILVDSSLEQLDQYYADKYFKSPYVCDAFVVVDYFPHMKPQGKWLHFTAAAIRDENGSIIGAVETLEDVSERIATQEELMRVNKVQSLILDNSAVGIAFIRNRIFEWVNPQLPAMLGRSADELLGVSTRIIYISDEEFALVGHQAYQALGQGQWFEFVLTMPRSDGTTYIGRILGKALDSENPGEGSIWIFEDITRRQEYEEELKRVNRVQSLILDNSAVGIAFVRDRIFEWVNPQLPAMLGRSADEVLGASSRIIYLGEEEFEEIGRQAYSALRLNQWFEFEATTRRRDGTNYIGRILGKALDSEHPNEGSIWIFEDITQRRELEEHIRRSDKLAALGQLAVGIAHEVRNPLGSIRGFALIVQRDLPPDDPLQRFVEIIIKESERLGKVTQELLDFARPARVEFASINLNRLVEKALFLVEIDLTSRQVEFKRQLEDSELIINGSEEKLIQVLLNLLQNALQAIGDRKGTIAIETRKASDSWAELKISDTGEGILPENLNKLFDPFFTTRTSGTGLGLALVHQIMDRHGGRIQVNSRYQEGTSIVLKFPRDGAS